MSQEGGIPRRGTARPAPAARRSAAPSRGQAGARRRRRESLRGVARDALPGACGTVSSPRPAPCRPRRAAQADPPGTRALLRDRRRLEAAHLKPEGADTCRPPIASSCSKRVGSKHRRVWCMSRKACCTRRMRRTSWARRHWQSLDFGVDGRNGFNRPSSIAASRCCASCGSSDAQIGFAVPVAASERLVACTASMW